MVRMSSKSIVRKANALEQDTAPKSFFRHLVCAGIRGLTETELKRRIGIADDGTLGDVVALLHTAAGERPAPWFQDGEPETLDLSSPFCSLLLIYPSLEPGLYDRLEKAAQ